MLTTFRLFALLVIVICTSVCSSKANSENATVIPADGRIDKYIPLLTNKKVAILMNKASVYNDTLVLDRLLANGVNVVKIFVPEHGFRGSQDAGEHVTNSIDSNTGISVISLYGKHKKPTEEDLSSVDVFIYDLQDVGVRFYTYISSLQYCIEACAGKGIPIIVLDRPNPNGFYVDGPVLDTTLRSFVGMQPIPVVYGMTPGEYAKMIVGEKWIDLANKVQLTVIPCLGYDHTTHFAIESSPSPNLRDMAAIYAYPSLCLFEGTAISVGRGTDKPFRQYGHPLLDSNGRIRFLPLSGQGAKHPLYEGRICYGEFVAKDSVTILKITDNKLHLGWVIQAYKNFPEKNTFFNDFFDKLAGTRQLRLDIQAQVPERDIRRKWKTSLKRFKTIRKKYLLYPDFE